MNASFEERSVWIQLVSLVLVLGGYAFVAWQMPSQGVTAVATGVLAGITSMVLSVPNVWTAHLLLVSLFLSEVLKLVLQLVYYRRGM